MIHGSSTFIHVGQLHIDTSPAAISTVLGSCVAVCLYDARLGMGAMNHYLLPFWNGNGLQSPKFGNISIPKLIEMMISKGSNPNRMEAKIFGGASLNIGPMADKMMIGEKNIMVAKEILNEYRIPIAAQDVGGRNGRKIQFDLERGKILMKYVTRSEVEEE